MSASRIARASRCYTSEQTGCKDQVSGWKKYLPCSGRLHARLRMGCQRARPYRLDEMEEHSTSYTSGLVHLGGRLALHATGDAGGQPIGIAV